MPAKWRHVQMKCGVNDSFSEQRPAEENSIYFAALLLRTCMCYPHKHKVTKHIMKDIDINTWRFHPIIPSSHHPICRTSAHVASTGCRSHCPKVAPGNMENHDQSPRPSFPSPSFQRGTMITAPLGVPDVRRNHIVGSQLQLRLPLRSHQKHLCFFGERREARPSKQSS